MFLEHLIVEQEYVGTVSCHGDICDGNMIEDFLRHQGGGSSLVETTDALASHKSMFEHPFRTTKHGDATFFEHGVQSLGSDFDPVCIAPE